MNQRTQFVLPTTQGVTRLKWSWPLERVQVQFTVCGWATRQSQCSQTVAALAPFMNIRLYTEMAFSIWLWGTESFA
jgi:hypothetical protein